MWGRNINISFQTKLLCLLLFTFTPFIVFYYITIGLYCDYDLEGGGKCVIEHYTNLNVMDEMWSLLISYNILIWWILLQLILAVIPDVLHKIIPWYSGGKKKGLISPGGHIYGYNINGLQAWLISNMIFILGIWYDIFSATVVYDNWKNILIIATIMSYIITIGAYIKAYIAPTNHKDRKFSGDKFYDFFMGIELNPRFGKLDWKLFLNGRPGIIGWSIINLSFAAKQYSLHGYVSNSMILVNFLQLLYIGYFFYREAWYLKTLDISHDHFGWMFAFGDLVWLPAMYTLQALYLVHNPIDLSFSYFFLVLLLGCFGFYIFASSNNEKDRFRSHEKNYIDIDDKSIKTISCVYSTADGKIHHSQLLISGWWGVCRHINYTGDLLLSLAYSLSCGLNSIFPYFYIIYLTILLVHRSIRDDTKCKDKYGESWDLYRRKVPYLFIPHII